MRLLDGDGLSGFGLPVLRERVVVVLVKLARRIVRNVEQSDRSALRKTRNQKKENAAKYDEDFPDHLSPLIVLPWTTMGRMLASVFFLRFFCWEVAEMFAISANEVLSRILAAASRTARNTL